MTNCDVLALSRLAVYFLSFMFNVGLTGLDKWLATFDQPVNSTLTSDFLSNNLAR